MSCVCRSTVHPLSCKFLSRLLPIKKNATADPHASNKFFNIVFCTFFNLTQPAHSIANPVCIKNISAPDNVSRKLRRSSPHGSLPSLISLLLLFSNSSATHSNRTVVLAPGNCSLHAWKTLLPSRYRPLAYTRRLNIDVPAVFVDVDASIVLLKYRTMVSQYSLFWYVSKSA